MKSGHVKKELPLGATYDHLMISKRIVAEYTKQQDLDELALKLLNLVYAKGGDYSEQTLRAFAESYF